MPIGCEARLGKSVQDLLDLLVSGGGVYLDVGLTHQDAVEVRDLQAQPVLAEEKREAVLQCLEILRPAGGDENIVIKFSNIKLPCGGLIS